MKIFFKKPEKRAPRKIVLLNPKGGSGKTTIATNLAAYFAGNGYSTVLMDYDSQGSSMRWLSKRPRECASIYGIDMCNIPKNTTRTFAARLPPDTQRIVVDTPAALARRDFANMARAADRILIPVLPSEIDIQALIEYITDLLPMVKTLHDENSLGVVANRIKRHTIAYKTLMQFLNSLEIPVVGIFSDAQLYIRASDSGRGVYEIRAPELKWDLVQWKSLIDWLETD